MTVDISELTEFAAKLRHVGTEIAVESRKVVTKAAMNIKKDSRITLSSQLGGRSSSLAWLPISISYDITSGDGETFAEVGPDQSISGLGRGVEFGSRNHAPIPFMVPAFDRESPKFEEALVDVVAKVVKSL